MNNQPAFQRIALMGRQGIHGLSVTLIAVKDYLLSLGYEVTLEKNTAKILSSNNQNAQVRACPAEKLKEHADILIVVGGDGSLLNASHIAVPQGLPVLGINRGKLGFLTDIHPNDLSKIDAILKGQYQKEDRFLLEANIQSKDHELVNKIALNDIVLLPGHSPKMIEFAIYIDLAFVCQQRADGLIVTTPTGSTAYALSGGGPILHPALDAIALVPMFPHTLTSRPIVVKANKEIKIVVLTNQDNAAHLSCDGKDHIPIRTNMNINIQKHDQLLTLIHPMDYSYYDTLRRKLDWQKRAALLPKTG